METQPIKQKPQPVGTAVNLLWATLAVGLIKSMMEFSLRSAQATTLFTTFVLVITFALIGFLIFKISSGKNWARITLFVLFVIGVLPTLFIISVEFSRSFILGALSVAQIGLQGYAQFLLFTRSGSTWFRKVLPN
jgi:hypothetical protein